MNLFYIKNIKIWQRLILLFQILSIPIIVIFITFLVVTDKLHKIETRIILRNISGIRAAYNVEISLLNFKGLKANHLLDNNTKWLRDFDKNIGEFNFWYNEAFKNAKTESEKDILSALSLDMEKYLNYHETIIRLAALGKKNEAQKLLLNESSQLDNSIYQGCEKLITRNEELIQESENLVNKYLKYSRILSYGTIICFVLFGIFVLLLITKSIVDPIKEMEKDSDAVVSVEGSKNEMGRLKERFAKMITTIQDNQKKLVQTEKKAAVGEIAAGISHELNNPIGIIYGFSEMLLKKNSLPPAEKSMVQDIYNEAQRCKKLLGQLLDFARTPEPNYRVSDIKPLIRKCLRLFKNQDVYKKIKFTVAMPSEPLKVSMDSVQIRQVLVNLLINACNAVNINNGTIHVNLTGEGEDITIAITDNGYGVKPDLADKIFIPFFSTKAKGTGLGLSVCRDIIEKHNGSLSLDTEFTKGARFIITIPRRKHGK